MRALLCFIVVALGACDSEERSNALTGIWRFDAHGTGAVACTCQALAPKTVVVPFPVVVRIPVEAVQP